MPATVLSRSGCDWTEVSLHADRCRRAVCVHLTLRCLRRWRFSLLFRYAEIDHPFLRKERSWRTRRPAPCMPLLAVCIRFVPYKILKVQRGKSILYLLGRKKALWVILFQNFLFLSAKKPGRFDHLPSIFKLYFSLHLFQKFQKRGFLFLVKSAPYIKHFFLFFI